jgi:hypothetical protein
LDHLRGIGGVGRRAVVLVLLSVKNGHNPAQKTEQNKISPFAQF